MIDVVIPYYNNKQMLDFQIENWGAWGDDILNQLHFVIVDDGSPKPLSANIPEGKFNMTIARIEENIPWNFSGAKNLGVHLAKNYWFLLHDVDYVFSKECMNAVLELSTSDPTVFYRFKCIMHKSGKAKRKDHYPISSFFCNYHTFWDVGGHDEDFSGHYTCHDNAVYWKLTRDPGNYKDITLNFPYMEAYVKSDISDADTDHEAEGWSRDGSRNRELLSLKRQKKVPWNEIKDCLRFDWRVVRGYRRDKDQ